MGHELICTWLGLEPGEWPPDHYRLLGLKPGEDDAQLIEQQVHQRMDAVRCYQVCHPEQATEAMNRLAQAFDCLTEPAAKQRYDANLLGPLVTRRRTTKPPTMQSMPVFIPEALIPEEGRLPPENNSSTASNPILPPPLPASMPPLPDVAAAVPEPLPAAIEVPRPAPPPPRPPAEKVDPILEAARSLKARRGLGTRRALLRRVRRTRELFETWLNAGKYLGVVKRRTTIKETEEEELAELFARILRLCRRLPRFLGEAGQPGYLVLSLAANDPVPTYLSLEVKQREALRRDWQAGRSLLLAHRDFLREQASALRLMTRGQRFRRAVRTFFTDEPAALIFLIVLAAANGFLWWSWLHRPR